MYIIQTGTKWVHDLYILEQLLYFFIWKMIYDMLLGFNKWWYNIYIYIYILWCTEHTFYLVKNYLSDSLIWFPYISFYCMRSNFLPSIQTTHFCLYKKDFVFHRLFYIYLLLFEEMSIMTSWSCLSFPTHVKQVVLTTSLGWFPISHIPSRARWGRGARSCVRSWPPC